MLEERQRTRLVLDVLEDRVHEPLLELEADAARRLLDRLPQPLLVERRDERLVRGGQLCRLRVGGEPRVEVGAHRRHDDGLAVGDGGGVDEIGEEPLALRLVARERERLLELVDDEDDPRRRRRVGEREGHGEVQRPLVGGKPVERALHRAAGDDVGELRGERGQRPRTRPKEADLPGLAPRHRPAPQRRHQPRTDERRLARAGRPEHGEEARGLELLEQPLDIAFAAEEDVGVLLVEGLEAAVGRPVVGADRGLCRPQRHTSHRVDKPLEPSRLVPPLAEVDPRPRGEERRQGARVERLGQPGKQHREEPEIALLRRAVERHAELLQLPVPEVV